MLDPCDVVLLGAARDGGLAVLVGVCPMALAAVEAGTDVAAHQGGRHVAVGKAERVADLVGEEAGEVVQVEEGRRREEIEGIAFAPGRDPEAVVDVEDHVALERRPAVGRRRVADGAGEVARGEGEGADPDLADDGGPGGRGAEGQGAALGDLDELDVGDARPGIECRLDRRARGRRAADLGVDAREVARPAPIETGDEGIERRAVGHQAPSDDPAGCAQRVAAPFEGLVRAEGEDVVRGGRAGEDRESKQRREDHERRRGRGRGEAFRGHASIPVDRAPPRPRPI